MSHTKISLICKNNIPVLMDVDLLKKFTNIYKIIVEENKNKIIIDDVEVKTLNNIIEYLKLLNIIDKNKNGPTKFIEQLDDNSLYDIIIASNKLGIPKIILDFGNKIRETLN